MRAAAPMWMRMFRVERLTLYRCAPGAIGRAQADR
jgi:hypothetical protein